jgi:hypothetical protein
MRILFVFGITGFLMLCSAVCLGRSQAGSDHSQEAISDLTSHLTKRAMLVGRDLPPVLKAAIKELVRHSPEKQTVEVLTMRLIVLLDMNRYLDYKRLADPKQRDLIKRFKTAFTLDEHWPIYINGESELYAAAEARLSEGDSPAVYKLAAVLAHERVHAEGEPSETKAIEEEIRVLEVFAGRRLVVLEWLIARKRKLAQLRKGQVSNDPLKVKTRKP